MKPTIIRSLTAALLLVAGTASAQGDLHDRTRGEASPGTQAPTRESLMNAIQAASPTALFSLLEYGERVECHECVPLLQHQLLANDDARVREIAAWWLRRRPFGFAAVYREVRTVLATDADPIRRARAAEALGEFMDPHGVTHLNAALADGDARVRLAAVRGLGRINAPTGNAAIARAMGDADPQVRDAAVQQVMLVNFFTQHDALMERLDDDTAAVRRRAALVIGQIRVPEAVPALAGLLAGDSDPMVRQAAAWALGRVGGTDARNALTAQRTSESASLVRDAIEVALRMR
ncbi:MAG: HEAT repeat domain-containing protein [Sandaracinaceae bacterium]|nr:HEAT repeat domain-containing protein [Sandaracinaceae bacterium]